jgi:Skp family chaperone for outer membrane proteins
LIQRLDQKIAAACKMIAEQKKIDLVLIEHTPAIPVDLTALTPDQFQALLKQKTVVYKSDKTDITQAVIALLNADYAKSEQK